MKTMKAEMGSAFKEKMVVTKNRGPKKGRYHKLPSGKGKKVDYRIPLKQEG